MASFSVAEGREMVDAERATELLRELPAELTSLSLSGKSYGTDAARRITARLTQVGARARVRSLNLADVIAGRAEREAHDALRELTRAFLPPDSSSSVAAPAAAAVDRPLAFALRSLDLSDNALGVKGVRELAPLLRACGRQLEELSFNNNGLNADAVALVHELLLGSGGDDGAAAAAPPPAAPPLALRSLSLSNNLLESAGGFAAAKLIADAPALERFAMRSARVGADGAAAVANALARAAAPDGDASARSSPLREIDVSDNTFGRGGTRALAALLRSCDRLEIALLRDLSIEEDDQQAVHELFSSLARGYDDAGGDGDGDGGKSRALRVLDVSTNELGEYGAEQLAAALRRLRRLETLRADENELGSAGARAVAAALLADGDARPAMEELRELGLADNEIGSAGAREVAKAAALLPRLTKLDLNGNAVGGGALQHISDLLAAVLGAMDDNIEASDGDDEEDGDDERRDDGQDDEDADEYD